MKDRWKILIVSLVISLVLALLFLFLGFSFKIVGLREYGVLEYSFYQTVDPSLSVHSNGNYLVGIDYDFIKYPKGLLRHNFVASILTQDKSMIHIEGLFIGQLIQSQIINLHFSYGPSNFFRMVTKTIEQTFRQSLEIFLLTEIISQRQNINSYVSSNVCLNVQSKYSFINCQYASTGAIQINASPVILPPQNNILQYYKHILRQTIDAQQKMNVYSNGGFDLIESVEELNSQLFLNATSLIVETISAYTSQTSQIFAGASYILNNPLMPVLNNSIYALKAN